MVTRAAMSSRTGCEGEGKGRRCACMRACVCVCVRCVCILTQHHNKSGISRSSAGNTAVQEGAYRGPVGAGSTQCACRSREAERKIKKQSVRPQSWQLPSLLLNSFSAPGDCPSCACQPLRSCCYYCAIAKGSFTIT